MGARWRVVGGAADAGACVPSDWLRPAGRGAGTWTFSAEASAIGSNASQMSADDVQVGRCVMPHTACSLLGPREQCPHTTRQTQTRHNPTRPTPPGLE